MRKLMREMDAVVWIKIGLILAFLLFPISILFIWIIGIRHGMKDISYSPVVLDLSYGYFSGYTLYLLLTYFPQRIEKERVHTVIKNDLAFLYTYMSEILTIIKLFNNIDKDIDKIEYGDIKNMNGQRPQEKEMFCYQIEYVNGKEKAGNDGSTFITSIEYYEILQRCVELIRRRISSIKSVLLVNHSSTDLSTLIAQIENSHLLLYCSNLARIRNPHDFGKELYSFIQLYEKMKSLKFEKHTYDYRKIEKEEMANLVKGSAKNI